MIELKTRALGDNKDAIEFTKIRLEGNGTEIRNELTAILLAVYDKVDNELVVDAISQFTKELAERGTNELYN